MAWWSLHLVPYSGYTALITFGFIRVQGCCDRPGVARIDPSTGTMLDIKYFNTGYNNYASINGDRKIEMVVDNSSNLYCAFSNPVNLD